MLNNSTHYQPPASVTATTAHIPQVMSLFHVIEKLGYNNNYKLLMTPNCGARYGHWLVGLHQLLYDRGYKPLKVVVSELAYAEMPLDWREKHCDRTVLLVKGKERVIGYVQWP
jgi:hypothetical protein